MTATIVTVSGRRRMSRKDAVSLIILLAVLVPLPWLAAQAPSSSGYFVIPGDAKAGMQTFFDKGCIRCHAVLGEGGKSAPDLGRAPAGHLSAAELVAAMWNHAPQMWTRMQEEKVTPPAFNASEMTNLFAFLYSVRSMDEPGDAERGRRLFSDKRCAECHKTTGGEKGAAPDLRQWGAYRNAVSWIQAMWNHAPAMQAKMEARGFTWPELQGSEVADLIAYVRTQATNRRQHFYLQPANPEVGRALFQQKGCANCHGLRGSGGAAAPDLGTRALPRTLGQLAAPDLGTRALPRTLGQLAALMWNHSPAMWASMRSQQIRRPQFSNKEMADLVAYLFAERYFEASGKAANGARVFELKGCAACHLGANKSKAPALSGWRGRVSPVNLATAMWNHGPVMLGRMREQQIPWPEFRPGEMVDLMEFLNSGLNEERRKESRR